LIICVLLGLAKFFDKSHFPLNSGKCNSTSFVAIEAGPSFTIETLKESRYITNHHYSLGTIHGIDEVDESIANITVIVEIHAEVEKIIGSVMRFIDKLQKHSLM